MVQKALSRAAWNSIFLWWQLPSTISAGKVVDRSAKKVGHWCARAVAYSKWISKKAFPAACQSRGLVKSRLSKRVARKFSLSLFPGWQMP